MRGGPKKIEIGCYLNFMSSDLLPACLFWLSMIGHWSRGAVFSIFLFFIFLHNLRRQLLDLFIFLSSPSYFMPNKDIGFIFSLRRLKQLKTSWHQNPHEAWHADHNIFENKYKKIYIGVLHVKENINNFFLIATLLKSPLL